MIPSRWELRHRAKQLGALAALLYLLAGLLDRTRQQALQVSGDKLRMHEWEHHQEDDEGDE